MAEVKTAAKGAVTEEPKGKSLDDEVQVFTPSIDTDEEPESESELEKNARLAAEHARQVRSKPVEQIFEEMLHKVGGTTPREAGAEVVMLKEYGEKMPTVKRQERIGIWTEKFLAWVKKQGKEIRSEGGALMGYGDRIEITMNGHYRYKW